MPDGVTVCENCGTSLDDLPDVDNSDAIARMLAGGEESAEKLVVESGDLSEEQMKDFQSGKLLEFSRQDLTPEEMEKLADMDEESIKEFLSTANLLSPEQDAADSTDEENIILKQGVTELLKFRLPKIAKKIIFYILSAAVGFSLGFGVHMLLTRDIHDTNINNIGVKSVKAVLQKIPQGNTFKAYDIYVKIGTDITECIIFGVLYNSADNYHSTYYRLLINNHDDTDATLYRPFDDDEYRILLQGTDEEQIKAAVMKGYYDNFRRSVNEINSGSSLWSKADTDYINIKAG